MTTQTFYVALPFMRTRDGHLVPGEAKQCDCAASAEREATIMRSAFPGAVAFSRMVDPAAGRCSGAALLASLGEVPRLDYLLAA